MAKRSDHSGGTALKTRPRAGRIVLWAVLAALLLGAVIGVVSLLGRPSGAETPENTAAPTAAPAITCPTPLRTVSTPSTHFGQFPVLSIIIIGLFKQ